MMKKFFTTVIARTLEEINSKLKEIRLKVQGKHKILI